MEAATETEATGRPQQRREGHQTGIGVKQAEGEEPSSENHVTAKAPKAIVQGEK